ncbi:MAG: Ig domain-containing protein [Candidatus Hydrogenedentes bacterium]|nr:Ig domain-containing protein [Candidatus Hydrogenedentota bacterium]
MPSLRALTCFASICTLLTMTTAGSEAFTILGEHAAGQVITQSHVTYPITVGGTADMDNTATRRHETWSIAFQNNIALVIENTGNVPVVNPRIITNDKRKFHTVESMIAEFTEGARDEQERIYMIWEGLRQNRHHDYPLFGGDFHDPVRFLNIYGGGFCDDSSASGSALYATAGFNESMGGKDPFQRGLHGHVMCEVWHDGDYQFMDIDQDTFFLDRENRKPVSGDAATRDHDLARRELAFGPLFPGWESGIANAAMFGADDTRNSYWSTGHRMDYVLRPGERMAFYWDKTEKTPWKLQASVHRYYSNSELVYAVPFAEKRLTTSDLTMDGFVPEGDHLAITSEGATMTIPVATAYTICGATLLAGVSPDFPPSAAFIVELSLDGKKFKEIYRRMALPRWEMTVPLDGALEIAGGAPKRNYWIRIRCEKAVGASLTNITLQTDLYAYPMALPRLSVGKNTVAYSDETTAPHEITITHRWRESGNVMPPVAPKMPESPTAGAAVHATYVPFAWPAVAGCDAYWLRVSRDPDFKFPYRPNYDQVLPDNHYEVPFRGMFSPGETYYWRIRPRLANGLWGDWSDTWSFSWQGPTVPRGLALTQDSKAALTLRWETNPSGNPPVRYRVYASNERGFSVGNDIIRAMAKGPAPLSVETTDTAMLVGGRTATGPLANLAYYRVVAIDADGVESCPSDYVELPRPFVYTAPVTTAKAGAAYQYQLKTVSSLGDWQHRYDSPGDAFWEKEGYRFDLVDGPAWLTLDSDTGLLQGTPPAGSAGAATVNIQVTTTFPNEVKKDGVQPAAFIESKAGMVGTYEHTFLLTVGTASP